MLVTRTSILTSKTRTRNIPITLEQLTMIERDTPVSVAAPHLSKADQEFLIAGTLPEDEKDFEALFASV